MNSLKPCYYITLLRAPQYRFHGYHLSLFNMRYRCRIAFPHLRCNVLYMKDCSGGLFVCLASALPVDQKWAATVDSGIKLQESHG